MALHTLYAWRPGRCVSSSFFFRAALRQFVRSNSYDAAVIGAGITGLTTAYRLSQDPQCSKVTVYEQASRIGGWLQSEQVPVGDGHVLFEYGPRTLRTNFPGSLAVLDLIHQLGLEKDILLIRKDSVAATNRFVYYPDHLVRMPGPIPGASRSDSFWTNLRTVWEEPVFRGLFRTIWKSYWAVPRDRVGQQSAGDDDESVADLVSRIATRDIADNLASAMAHGIYAGDVDQLSAAALMGALRDMTYKDGFAAHVLALATNRLKIHPLDPQMAFQSVARQRPARFGQKLKEAVGNAPIMTLRNGISQLADGLGAALQSSNKVSLLTSTEVSAISREQNSSDLTVIANGEARIHNRVVATNPSPSVAKQLKAGASSTTGSTSSTSSVTPQTSIQLLEAHSYAVTVMVVNLFYDTPDLLPVTGFGYLIPRSVAYDQNPERALGVIFASNFSADQDSARGTKVAVMLGGHLWDGWTESDYPDHEAAVKMARALLERHLGITETPAVARSRLQRNAIPQYTVGHPARMRALSDAVRSDFDHRLTLAGSWYAGVGVNDCVTQGYMAAAFGVGAQRLTENVLWANKGFRDWDLEGGIVTSPLPYVTLARY